MTRVHLRRLEQEEVLEAGFVALAASVLAGLGVLVFGRLAGDARRARRHAEHAPSAGSVPRERHQHYASSPR